MYPGHDEDRVRPSEERAESSQPWNRLRGGSLAIRGSGFVVPARHVDEERGIGIGGIGRQVWVAVFTFRNEHLRLISVRRARAAEVTLYEGP